MTIGTRVEIHPMYDRWMRGDRYGEIVKIDSRREYAFVQFDNSSHIRRYPIEDLTEVG